MKNVSDSETTESTGNVILICGGSSSGKSSAVQYMKTIKSPIALMHFDYDQQIMKNMKSIFDVGPTIDKLINTLPTAANGSSFVMDHWMPPKYELIARSKLINFKPFYVWLYCSSVEELERREAQRNKDGNTRDDGMALSGQTASPPIAYDYILDTSGKKPRKIARLIYQKALKHWGYK